MTKNTKKNRFGHIILKILKSPVTLVISIVLGVLAAKFFGGPGKFLSLFGDIYLKALQMCVIPIVCGAVAVNIGELFKPGLRAVLGKVLIAAVVVLLASSTIGTLSGVAAKKFLEPDSTVTEALSKLQETGNKRVPEFISVSYYNGDDIAEDEEEFSALDFFKAIVPSNIFEAATAGDILKIIFFFAVFGIMLTMIDPALANPLKKSLQGLYEIFCRFINLLLLILPVGMFSVVAKQFAVEGMSEVVKPLFKLAVMIYVVCFIIIGVVFIVIQLKSKVSVKTHLTAIQRIFFLCISTSSCIAALPVTIEDTIKHFKLKGSVAKAIIPISVMTVQSGVIAATSVLAVFGAVLFSVPLNVNAVLLIIVGSIFYALSIIGVPGIVAATMIGIVVTPLGIPAEVISVLMMSIVMFFDPIAVFTSEYTNVGVAVCITPREETAE